MQTHMSNTSPKDPFAACLELARQGRYSASLTALESTGSNVAESIEARVLRTELWEIVGAHSRARDSVERLLKSSRITDKQRATCESVLGRILVEDGHTDAGLSHLQRAASLSSACGDLRQLCWIQCKLLSIISEKSGPEAATPLLGNLRRTATKLGDPEMTDQWHIFVAKM